MSNWKRSRRSTAQRVTVVLAVLIGMGLGGCATPPPAATQPKTTVILLPDSDGHVGAVRVTNGAGSQMLDKAYSSATSELQSVKAPQAHDGTAAAVESVYADLLKAQPSPPRSFVLYFQLDQTQLTDASKAQLAAVLQTARQRKPTEITVFGHADSSGSDERNLKLSADRARLVAEMLRAHDPDVGPIEIQFFGDKAPLVPSAPGTPEPRNRRAEIVIL